MLEHQPDTRLSAITYEWVAAAEGCRMLLCEKSKQKTSFRCINLVASTLSPASIDFTSSTFAVLFHSISQIVKCLVKASAENSDFFLFFTSIAHTISVFCFLLLWLLRESVGGSWQFGVCFILFERKCYVLRLLRWGRLLLLRIIQLLVKRQTLPIEMLHWAINMLGDAL